MDFYDVQEVPAQGAYNVKFSMWQREGKAELNKGKLCIDFRYIIVGLVAVEEQFPN